MRLIALLNPLKIELKMKMSHPSVVCALVLFSATPLHAQTPSSNTPASSQSRLLPSSKYEQPKHRVIEQIDAIEIRDYQPMLLAEVDVVGERSSAMSDGFRILAGYIFGGNTSRSSIAMTSPVTQTDTSASLVPSKGAASEKSEKIAMTSPVTLTPSASTDTPSEKTQQRWTVAFMLPSKYTIDTLPKPNNPQIRFRESTPERRVAIRFSGFSTESNLSKHRDALEAFVASRNLKTVGVPILSLYDDPFTAPWNRRNEWWVTVAAS